MKNTSKPTDFWWNPRGRMYEPLSLRKPRFVRVTTDLFSDDVPQWFVDNVINTINGADRHTFLLLTKHIDLAEKYVWSKTGPAGSMTSDIVFPPNLWLGAVVETHKDGKNAADLLTVPAAKHVLALCPMRGPVDPTQIVIPITGPGSSQPCAPPYERRVNLLTGDDFTCDWHSRGAGTQRKPVDWVVCCGGNEPLHPDWVRLVRDKCVEANVPFAFEGWGDWTSVRPRLAGDYRTCELLSGESYQTFWYCGRALTGRILDGELWDQRLD